jgi:hypothetical protein
MDTSIELEDWALPQINKIVKEIKENEGKVSKIKTNSIFIEIVSQIKNFIRYDQISKDSVVTYSVPKNIEFNFNF